MKIIKTYRYKQRPLKVKWAFPDSEPIEASFNQWVLLVDKIIFDDTIPDEIPDLTFIEKTKLFLRIPL